MRCNVLLLGGAFWMEYSRTTGFCAASITLVAAEANADDEVSVEGTEDEDAADRAEVSDTENALLAVTAAAAGDEFGGMFFLKRMRRDVAEKLLPNQAECGR